MVRTDTLSHAELKLMRASCKLAADCLLMVGDHLRAGMTTQEVDDLVHQYTLDHDAVPSPLGYGPPDNPFPRSVCTSVNEVVCHGIPGPYVLKDGDIVNVDVTNMFPKVHGYHGDTSATFYVGEPSPMAKHVTEVARQALEVGIAVVKPGRRVGDIGAAIQAFVESKGCSVVREYTGHGIGRLFHTAPTVCHYATPNTPRIKRGMTFTIEPMVNVGDWPTELMDDGWTVLTKDRSLSAQFEHTLLVTKSGVEVLTQRDRILKGSEDVDWAEVGPLSGPKTASA